MIDTRLAPYGIFLLRLSLGVMFIAHAVLKYAVFTMPGFAGFLGTVGLPAAFAFAGGIAILLGFYGRWASAALLPVLLGALAIQAPNGWLLNAPNGGWEYPAFLAAAALTHILAGDGALAVRPAALPVLSGPAPTPRAA